MTIKNCEKFGSLTFSKIDGAMTLHKISKFVFIRFKSIFRIRIFFDSSNKGDWMKAILKSNIEKYFLFITKQTNLPF